VIGLGRFAVVSILRVFKLRAIIAKLSEGPRFECEQHKGDGDGPVFRHRGALAEEITGLDDLLEDRVGHGETLLGHGPPSL
jgi:hypothetical protein